MGTGVNDLVFIPESAPPPPAGQAPLAPAEPWQILIIDDEPEVHQITHMALRGFSFGGRPLAFSSAYTAKEACTLLQSRPPFDLVLVDAIMETEDAGLQVVRFIRDTQRNKRTRLVLRTGPAR